ncbi:MAG TPA: trypsin-like peptidase domain-containing protein, partial [Acidimicrobiales bacterium]|nr:trypsin-like peptidase domain-containing protein [Acidimicrobiales bacterium]
MTDETFEDKSEEASATDTPPIAMPPVTPPASEAPAGSAPPPPGAPTGSYALGALAGNPLLTPPPGTGAAGPPTAPVAPPWFTPLPPPVPETSANRLRNGLLVGAAAVVAIGAGIGLGHAVWKDTVTPLSSASGNNGTGSSGSNGFNTPPGFGPDGNPNFGSGSGPSGSANASGPSDVSAIAAKVDPGLVDINTSLGYAQEQAAGTGIVLSPNGEILTNNHVIEGATTISVTDVGNGKTYSASVVGYDRSQDIAVLQLHGASGLQTAALGKSSTVSVGQGVVGVGNAGGT